MRGAVTAGGDAFGRSDCGGTGVAGAALGGGRGPPARCCPSRFSPRGAAEAVADAAATVAALASSDEAGVASSIDASTTGGLVTSGAGRGSPLSTACAGARRSASVNDTPSTMIATDPRTAARQGRGLEDPARALLLRGTVEVSGAAPGARPAPAAGGAPPLAPARRPRDELFPVLEQPAGGHFVTNLHTLGIAIGPHIVSPTGALFYAPMQIAGRGEPRYEPAEEIAQAICDRFVHRLCDVRLVASPAINQTLARHLSQISRSTPWLARALARAHDESTHQDLESAALATALFDVVEATARRNATTCLAAVTALQPPSERDPDDAELLPSESRLLSRHQTLFRDWNEGRLNPWQLRSALVEFYIQAGAEQLDQLFFSSAPALAP